jgi:hypothetical protein
MIHPTKKYIPSPLTFQALETEIGLFRLANIKQILSDKRADAEILSYKSEDLELRSQIRAAEQEIVDLGGRIVKAGIVRGQKLEYDVIAAGMGLVYLMVRNRITDFC